LGVCAFDWFRRVRLRPIGGGFFKGVGIGEINGAETHLVGNTRRCMLGRGDWQCCEEQIRLGSLAITQTHRPFIIYLVAGSDGEDRLVVILLRQPETEISTALTIEGHIYVLYDITPKHLGNIRCNQPAIIDGVCNSHYERSRHLKIADANFALEGNLTDDSIHGSYRGIALEIIHFTFRVVGHAYVSGLVGLPEQADSAAVPPTVRPLAIGSFLLKLM